MLAIDVLDYKSVQEFTVNWHFFTLGTNIDLRLPLGNTYVVRRRQRQSFPILDVEHFWAAVKESLLHPYVSTHFSHIHD